MITGPAVEAVKKVVKASSREIPISASISRLMENEKNRKKGSNKPNMIMGGVR
jgi:hypothetical protein